MNGIPVSQSQKTQNAPTWQVENTARERLFFCIFSHILHPLQPYTTET